MVQHLPIEGRIARDNRVLRIFWLDNDPQRTLPIIPFCARSMRGMRKYSGNIGLEARAFQPLHLLN
jgi:hypothetical protein